MTNGCVELMALHALSVSSRKWPVPGKGGCCRVRARIPPLAPGLLSILGMRCGTYIREMPASIPCKYGVKEILGQRQALSGLRPVPLADDGTLLPSCDSASLTVSSGRRRRARRRLWPSCKYSTTRNRHIAVSGSLRRPLPGAGRYQPAVVPLNPPGTAAAGTA